MDAQVKILIAENDLYLAEVGRPAALRVALGPRVAPDYDRSYWEKGGSGGDASCIMHHHDSSCTIIIDDASRQKLANHLTDTDCWFP